MSEPNRSDRGRGDAGLSLIEVLISVVMMGVLATTIAGVMIVSLRTTPPTEARVDDARGLQGLVTWIPQDVDAAAPDGFNRDPNAWPCAAPAPANSYNILAIGWTEQAAAATDFDASYRYEKTGEHWNIVRYFCVNTGLAERINLTSDLPPWNASDPPAYTVMCEVVIDASTVFDGNCPSADVHPASEYTPSPVRSLKLKVELANGMGVTIDAAPKNPDETLADDPDAASNLKPTAQNNAITLTIAPGATATFDLASYLGTVNDPDGDESRLTISVDPTEPLPSNLVSATTAYNGSIQFELTLTAGTTTGTATTPLMLVLSDERGGWNVITATIEVSDPPNVAPFLGSADPDTRIVGIPADEGTTTIAIPLLFNVQDDRPISELVVGVDLVTVTGPPNDVDTSKFTVTASGGDLIVDFDSGFHSSAGGEIYVDLHVADAEGATLVLHLTIQIQSHAEVNDAPVATTANVDVTIEAGQSATLDVTSAGAHGVYDIDPGDDLSASVLTPFPASITATASDTSVTVDVDVSAAAGIATPLIVRVSDIAGAYVDVTITVTITVPPPPPSDCVLGALTATPNPIARQGGGTAPRKLFEDVTVTLTYTGTCDGLRLNYDSGDPTGLGTGVGRVFPPGSPTSITIVGHFTGGTEKFTPGSHVLTASTSSAVSPSSVTTTLTVT